MSVSATTAYPVSVEGELDEPLSRWLWLVKWLLAFPHFIVLVLLWLMVVVATVVAFFAILFTRRYPRDIFDFNVGVLRWTWRVGFYSYSALATDRYPPFTLEERDYPATFQVDYPEELSRGLILIYRWLLAIPHYLILGFFQGGFSTINIGLNGLLVLFAAVALAFTGRYPKELFDLVLGINRWSLRVAVYGLLLREEYPPFRFGP